jgi:prepilin-type N-terminal cleavage/methylation domain-containing protein
MWITRDMTRRLLPSAGFTLVEVMMAVVILGVLVAVAVPSFVGQADKAHDAQARQQLSLAYQAAVTDAVDRYGVFGSTATVVGAINTSAEGIHAEAGVSSPATASAPDSGKSLVAASVTSNILTLRALSSSGNTCTLIASPAQPTPTPACQAPATQTANAPQNVVQPVVVGSAVEAHTLTGTQGTWDGSPSSYSYRWQRSNDDGAHWTEITGATGNTYQLVRADVGAKIRVVVGAANVGGTTTAASTATAAVTESAPVSISRPVISGTNQQGYTLTAGTGSWSSSTTPTFSYQWRRCDPSLTSCTNIAGATTASYDLQEADVDNVLVIRVVAHNPSGTSDPIDSAATAVIVPGPPLLLTRPQVTGSAQERQVLVADHGSWAASPSSFSYQWQSSVDGQTFNDVTGATAAAYTIARVDIAKYLRVKVIATNSAGPATAYSLATDAVVEAPPSNTALPQVTGTAQDGQTLTTSDGSWSSASTPTFSYQWRRCDANGNSCLPISGATAASYALGSADVAATVRVAVTATTGAGAATAISDPTATVSSGTPTNTALPTVTGTTQEGALLTAHNGSWSGSGLTYTYQWRSCDAVGASCASVTGATSSTYTLRGVDVGGTVRVVVTAHNSSGTAAATSAASAVITSIPPANTTAPTISGTAREGQTLTAHNGSWDGTGNSYSYQWQSANGAAYSDISGATATTYTATNGDIGKTLRVQVTASNSGGTQTASSAATSAVLPAAPANTTPPSVSGTTQEGQTLTGARGNWSGAGNSYGYKWQSSPNGSTWTDISGATTTTYTLTASDVGKSLRFFVTATNDGGTQTASSSATAVIVALPPANTVAPTITGTAQEGQTLTVQNGSWSHSPASYSYQWQRSPDGSSWANVAGGTNQTYTLVAADVDQQVRALVTATNSGGSSSQLAAAVQVVSLAPVNVTPPTVSGTVQNGQTLTASPGSWTSSGTISYAYQWQTSTDAGANWSAIAGATSATYVVQGADAGSLLRARVTATNSGGSVSQASDPTGQVPFPAPVSTSLPVISGNAIVGATVTTTTGGWTNSPSSYSYQWQRCNTAGASCAAISAATSGTYVVQTTDGGSTLRVAVTATNSSGAATATSDYSNSVSYSYSSAIQADGAVGYWRLGEGSGTTIVDALGQGHSGTYTGGTVTLAQAGATADGNTAAFLNGGWGSVPYYSALNPGAGQGLTMELWYKGAAPATNAAPLVMKSFTSHNPPYYQYGIQRNNTGNILVDVTVAGSWRAWDTGIAWPETTQWHYWVATYDRTANTLNFYLDGVLKASTAQTGDVSAYTSDFGIGDLLNLGSGYNITGRLDEVAIYTSALSCGTTTIGASCTGTSQIGSHYSLASATGSSNSAPASVTAPVVSGAAQVNQTLTASRGSWSGTMPITYAYQWQRCSGNYSGTVTADTPAGYWRLGETSGTTITDALGQGHTGSYTGSYSLGQSGATSDLDKATSFTGGWGSIPYYSGLNPGAGQGLTMEMWYKASVAPAQWPLLKGFTSHNDPYYQYGIGANGSAIRVVIDTTGTFSPWETGINWVTDNAWHYYAVTYDRSASQIRLYVDGVLKSSIARSGDVRAYATPLGLMDILNLGAGYNSVGQLDEAAVYTSALSQTQISSHYASATTNCANISGATSSSYVLVSADAGTAVRAQVTATNSLGSAAATSASSASVTLPVPTNTVAPSISGTVQEGQLLTAQNGTWSNSPTAYTYQWQRSTDSGANWSSISGQTAQTYFLASADAGNVVRVQVTATNSYGGTTAASAQTATVLASPPVNTVAPVVSGNGVSGQALTTTQGTWTSSTTPTYAYGWQRSTDNANWVTISGQTAASYTVQAADVGAYLRSMVIATNSGGSTMAFSPVMTALSSANVGYPAAVLADSPLAYFRLGDPSGTQISYSSASYAWNAIDWSDPGFTGASLGASGALAGDNDSAVSLSGVSSQKASVVLQTATSAPYTIEIWVKSTGSTGTWRAVLGSRCQPWACTWNGSYDQAFDIQIQESGSNYLLHADTGTGTAWLSNGVRATIAKPANGWVMLDLVITPTTGTWYGNGQPLACTLTCTWSGGTPVLNDGNHMLVLGSTGNPVDAPWVGSLDELAVYNSALNATQVLNHYNAAAATSVPSATAAPVLTAAGGDNLTTSLGSWRGSGNTYSYRWQSSPDGSSWSDISGATAATYTTTSQSAYVRAVVTASNGSGTSAIASNSVGPAVGNTSFESAAGPFPTGGSSGMIYHAFGASWQSIMLGSSPPGRVLIDGAHAHAGTAAANLLPDGVSTPASSRGQLLSAPFISDGNSVTFWVFPQSTSFSKYAVEVDDGTGTLVRSVVDGFTSGNTYPNGVAWNQVTIPFSAADKGHLRRIRLTGGTTCACGGYSTWFDDFVFN